MYLSVIVPVYNEEENVKILVESIHGALKGIKYEVILIDDGSTDNTPEVIKSLKDKKVKLIKFARNFGQTAALSAGFEQAKGEYIATLDGDLQNDPADIPAMLEKLKDEKLDMVSGIRVKRQDGMFLRKIPSLAANWLIRKITKVKITDNGCSLKVYKAQVAKRIELYGELHRFISILATFYGAKIGEMKVRHHARQFGQSKYGITRVLKVASDLILMFFFIKYKQKPMHLFGNIGISMFCIGSLIEFYLLIQKLFGYDIGQRPLFYIGILLIITSIQLITTGFIAELIMRAYYGSSNQKPYIIDYIDNE